MITVGSLFSGIGGFDEAFRRAGAVVRWHCEIDPAARAVLAAYFPEVPCYADVTTLDGRTAPAVDLICGGFPCQDLSVAGRRAGLAGSRSGLWWHFHRILSEHRPRWVLIENVPGLLSSNGGADFAALLRGLVECGYRCAWRVLDAQYFGVPQRRRRVFIVGYLGDGRAAEVLFESTGGAGHLEPGRTPGPRIAHALTAGATGAGYRFDPNGEEFITTTFNGYTGGADDNDAQGGHLVPAAIALSNRGHAPGQYAETLRADSHGALPMAFTERTRAAGRTLETRTDLAYALTNPGSGGRTHRRQIAGSFGVRRLTPLECERLQGFPDGWTAVAGHADSTRYRQLGNAVAVPVVEWIARRIVAAERMAPDA